MGKQSKSSATIRRRRYWSPALRQIVSKHKSAGDDNLDSDDDDDSDVVMDQPIRSPRVLGQILASQWTLFLGLLAFRFVNALVIQTSYVPDEYWQSIEVAHRVAFGYGHLTWEWTHGLRSYAYPACFALVYKILAILHLDYRILLIKVPRLLQAVLASVGDLYLYKLSLKLSGRRVALWALTCQLTSWFTFYCATRTLTNSVETSLTTIALYYYPWPGRPRKAHWKFVTLVGVAVVIRPTAAVVWLLMCVWHLSLWKHVAWKVVKLYAERGFLILSVSSLLDKLLYGRWVNVLYNFLEFNVLSGQAGFYGSHPWHWYLTQGLWVVLGSHSVLFVLAARRATEPVFLALIGWTTLMYSLLSHKEFRFLFPVLPLAMHVCGSYLHWFTEESLTQPAVTMTTAAGEGTDDPGVTAADTKQTKSPRPSPHKLPVIAFIKRRLAPILAQCYHGYCRVSRSVAAFWAHKPYIVAALVATNLPLALYTSVLHQRGTIDVMRFLAAESDREVAGDKMAAMFLMPCHSTPYYGYLHANVSLRFLTCEPDMSRSSDYSEEAAAFYRDPGGWLVAEEGRGGLVGGRRPSHLVMFSPLLPAIDEYLTARGYSECARFFHTHIPEGRVGSHVVVVCWRGWGRGGGRGRSANRRAPP